MILLTSPQDGNNALDLATSQNFEEVVGMLKGTILVGRCTLIAAGLGDNLGPKYAAFTGPIADS